MMTTFPLITHATLDKTIAWQHGRPIKAAKFLADAAHLASLLPAGAHVLNVCRDRYHFSVGLAASIMSSKVSLLPPAHTPAMVAQLQAFSADVFCLHDNQHCDIALPLMLYPDMPQHAPLMFPLAALPIPQIDSRQTIAIVFTSGSTGVPVPHAKSWGSLVQNVQAQAALLGLDDATDYTILGTVPPQHMYGLESTVLLPLQTGNALCSAQPFYPADILAALDALPPASLLVSTPLHLRLLLDAGLDIPQVALVLSATAPLSVQLAQVVESRFSANLLEIYGSTETGQIATRRTTQTIEWQLFPGVRLTERAGSIWASHGHVETSIALNDVIQPLTASHFLLHGRLQDLINIAGKRTSLANLNHNLNSIDGVLDGAFYMPDDISHDHVTRLSACVVAPKHSAQTLLAALRERIDPVFLPRPLLFVDALPRNSTGKLPHEALKQLVAKHKTQPSA